MTSDDADADGHEEFDVSTRIDDGRTEIRVEGDRSVAVIVRSESGERIYLPPEGFDRDRAQDSPYQSSRPARSDSPYQSPQRDDSPHQSPQRDDSPYQSARTSSRRRGLSLTADGFRILHPEPVTELTVFR